MISSSLHLPVYHAFPLLFPFPCPSLPSSSPANLLPSLLQPLSSASDGAILPSLLPFTPHAFPLPPLVSLSLFPFPLCCLLLLVPFPSLSPHPICVHPRFLSPPLLPGTFISISVNGDGVGGKMRTEVKMEARLAAPLPQRGMKG